MLQILQMIPTPSKGILVSVLMAVLLGTGVVKGIKDKIKEKEDSLESYQRMMADSVRHIRNAYGQEIAMREAAIVEAKAMSRDGVLMEELRFVNEKLGRRLQRLESYTKAAMTSRQQVSMSIKDSTIVRERTIGVYDTVQVKSMGYEDMWTKISGIGEGDSLDLDIEVSVPLKVVVHGGHWKLFGKERKWLPRTMKRIRVEAMSDNPNVRIDDIQVIKTK